MSLPNMKTFCLSTVKPLFKSLKEFCCSKTSKLEETQTAQAEDLTSLTATVAQLNNTVTGIIENLTRLRTELNNVTNVQSFENHVLQINENTSNISVLMSRCQELIATTNNMSASISTLDTNVTEAQQNASSATATANQAMSDVAELRETILGSQFSVTPQRDGGLWVDDDYTPMTKHN